MSVAQPLPIGFVSFLFGNFRLWLRQDYLVDVIGCKSISIHIQLTYMCLKFPVEHASLSMRKTSAAWGARRSSSSEKQSFVGEKSN